MTGPGRHLWQRAMVGWHVVFAALALLTAVLAGIERDTGAERRWAALGLLAGLCAWYAATGARALDREDPRLGHLYLAVAGPVIVGLFAVLPVGSLMLFALYPQMWALLPPRRAIAGTVAAVGSVGAVMLLRTGLHGPGLLDAMVPAVVALLFALLLGLWITKIIQQSTERARLVAELAAARAEVEAVSRDAGVLAERERLAREIHDTLAQGLTSIAILLDAVETELRDDQTEALRRLDQARRCARENLAETRAVVAALSPVDLERASLADAVVRLVDRFGAETGVTTRHGVSGARRALPVECEVVLLRAVQEALANVRKHAGAREVDVELHYHDDKAVLRVADDGRGFDASVLPEHGFGLAGMRGRVAEAGGVMVLESAPGTGTVLRVELPRPGWSDR
ncbi:sensor histidine kinase [Actinomadura sp. HBU206391]|uniref:sensor histidine kinase n=1 Tax=Actinomadura sp. HBU206391 TaxID=2731692 RepID=UPI00164FB897|nr:sensor histidine kinase [Actinomadura sp. HBU206391]MBC6462144.1 sensor histidine kinase [Actinomadura sp. HBU206391]